MATRLNPSPSQRPGCRSWPDKCASLWQVLHRRLAQFAWRAANDSCTSEVRSVAPALRRVAAEPRRVRACMFRPTRHGVDGCGQRAFLPSFRLNEDRQHGFDSSHPCETRSPRRHWPLLVGPAKDRACQPNHNRSINSRRVTRSPRRPGRAMSADFKTQYFGCLQINDQLDLSRLLNSRSAGFVP